MTTIGMVGSGLAVDLAARWRRFVAWWLKEFFNLFSDKTVEWMTGRRRALLAIAADADSVTLELLNGARLAVASERITAPADLAAEIDRFLQDRHVDRNETDIALKRPSADFFGRQLMLPRQAANAIASIVEKDLAKNTPFKASDVYSDYSVLETGEGNKIAVVQWIIRRHYVDQAIAALGLRSEEVAAVLSDSAVAEAEAFIHLKPGQHDRQSWQRKTGLALCGMALVLAIVAGGLRYWQQQAAIGRLEAAMESASRQAQQVRSLVNQLQAKQNALLHLRWQRGEAPGLIDIWEETSRVLPVNSWLTEFRLSEVAGKREPQVTLSGFSSAASALVAILDGSPLLYDVALTSPIALDGTEGRERFSLQAKVRMPDDLKGASR